MEFNHQDCSNGNIDWSSGVPLALSVKVLGVTVREFSLRQLFPVLSLLFRKF